MSDRKERKGGRNMTSYKIFCLSSAANIIAEEIVGQGSASTVIRNPMLLMATPSPQGQFTLSMTPLDLFNSKGEDLYLNRNSVLFSYEAESNLVEQYKALCDKVRAGRVGIILPPSGNITSMEDFKKK